MGIPEDMAYNRSIIPLAKMCVVCPDADTGTCEGCTKWHGAEFGTRPKKTLAVVGSRSFYKDNNKGAELQCKLIVQEFLVDIDLDEEYQKFVSGGADGPDKWGEEMARKFQLTCVIYKPDWAKYGRAAGFLTMYWFSGMEYHLAQLMI
jgi:hypothetical protein